MSRKKMILKLLTVIVGTVIAAFGLDIRDENLKENETRQFMEISFRDGAVKTTGTDIDKLLPPMSRFGGGNRAEKKQGVIAKLLGFFERFFGIG